MSDPTLPDLSPATLEALALISEECAEVGQAIGKALRHGLMSCHPSGGETNRAAISRELGQVQAVVEIAVQLGIISRAEVNAGANGKWRNVGKYLHHIKIEPSINRATVKQ